MKSFTTYVSLLQSMAKVPSTDSTNTALLTTFLNDSIRTMCNIRGGKWWFMETTATLATVASQSSYVIPARIRKLMGLTVTVGTTVYTPTPVFDKGLWDQILASEMAESDTPMYYYRQGNNVLIQPASASTAGTITFRGRKNVADMSVADATVSVTALANGATSATIASGGLVSMAGKYLRITADAAGAANKGDGYWYEIASAPSGTSIILTAPYQGVTLAASTAAAVVAQVSPIPEAYDMAPVYRALALYSQVNDPLHPSVATIWWRLYDGGQEAGLANVPGGLIGQMIENESSTVEASYISPNSVSHNNLSDEPEEITGL